MPKHTTATARAATANNANDAASPSAKTPKTKTLNKKQGIYAVLAAIAIQLTIGIAYIWSVFQTGIAASVFGGNNASASLAFSILLAVLTIGAVFGGKLATKYSTRSVVFAGGIIVSAGFLLASFVTEAFPWLLWVTYGVMGGIGMGLTYSTTITCCQRWYPHKKGLVTGIIVASLGFGGVVFTPVVERLIYMFGGAEQGWRGTFMVLSAVFLIACTIGSIFLKNPPEGHMISGASAAAVAAPKKAFTPSAMLKTPQFYLMLFTLMLACMGGLMMIAFARPIAVGKGLVETATIGVLAISITNSAGRLFWGMVSDKMGRINTIILLLAGNAGLPLLVNSIGHESNLIFVLIAFIGFFYGGLLSNFPALTADIFGLKHLATNYGFVLLGFGAGAIISSQIVGYYANIADAYGIDRIFPAFIIASVCAAAGIIMMLTLKKMTKVKE